MVGCTQAAGIERIQYMDQVFSKGRLCDFAQIAGTDVNLLHTQLYYRKPETTTDITYRMLQNVP